MIVLTAIYTIRPEDRDKIWQDISAMTQLVQENEPGCLMYRAHQSLDTDNRMLLYEAYRDQESFDRHSQTDYFQDIVLNRIVPRLIQRERALWEVPDDGYSAPS